MDQYDEIKENESGDLDEVEQNQQQHRRPIFMNHIRTDGHTVDVLLVRQKRHSELPDLSMDDFTSNELDQHFQLWGVDPGMKDIFTATDGAGQYRRFSTKEWRSKCGITRRFRFHQEEKRRQGITKIESSIPTTKTTSSTKLMTAVKYLINNLPRLTEFYSMVHWRKHRLHAYSGRQKLDQEMVNVFVDGGEKYNRKSGAQPRTSLHAK